MASDRRVCRVCLLEDDAIKLFNWHEAMGGFHEELSWMECFRRCTQLNVKAETAINIKTQYLCSSCAQELIASYQFITKAHKADQVLRLQYYGEGNQTLDVGCFEWVNVTNDKTNTTNEMCTQNEATLFEKSTILSSVEPINEESISENNIKTVIKRNDSLEEDAVNIFSSELFGEDFILGNEIKTNVKRKKCAKNISKAMSVDEEQISDNKTGKNIKRHNFLKKDFPQISRKELLDDEPPLKDRIKINIKRNKNLANIFHAELLNEESFSMYKLKTNDKLSKSSKKDVNRSAELLEEEPTIQINGKTKAKRNNCLMSEVVTCEQCPRKMERRHLKRHVSRYHRPKLLLCQACPRTFSVKNNLRMHELTHQEQRDVFTCEKCGKKLRTILTYRNHLKTHAVARERIHQCDQCEKTFLHKSSLSLHQLQHKGSTVVCNICQKGFVRQIDMLIHQRTHTGERHYKCPKCEKSFTQQRVLNKHMKSHDGTSHLCNFCGKKYLSYERLYYHRKEHTGMPYKCAVCEKEFSEIYKLKRHIKGVHKMEETEDIKKYIITLNK